MGQSLEMAVMCSQDKQPIVAKIVNAFQNVTLLGDDECSLLHPWCTDVAAVDDFIDASWNANWQSIPGDVIERNYASLSFFSPMAFRFYLPAFMYHALSCESQGCPVLTSTIHDLTPKKEYPTLRSYFESRVAAFTVPQIEAVLSFLEYARYSVGNNFVHRIAGEALDGYWYAMHSKRTRNIP